MRFFAFWGFIKMNILIVGNGFDLSHYLPTKYDHFMVAMQAIENWEVSKGDMSFDDLFGALYEKEDYFFGYTKAMYKTDELKISVDQIKELQDKLKDNVWYQYFNHHLSDIDSWIDFEEQIESVLNAVAKFCQEATQIYKLHERIDAQVFPLYMKNESNSNFICGENTLKKLKFLGIIVEREDSFIGSTINEINKDFFRNKNIGLDIDNSYIFRFLELNLRNFIDHFNFYLSNFVKNLVLKKQLKNEIIELDSTGELTIYSFNYTNTFQCFYDQNSIVQYLHGKSGEKNNIVLGISELKNSYLKSLKIYGFTKYHQKLFKQTDYLFLNGNDSLRNKIYPRGMGRHDLINICIWGHSLANSDENYVKEIFSYNDDSYCLVRIRIFYFNEDNFTLLNNLLDILGKEKIELWMKKGWLKFEKNPDIAKINDIEPIVLPKVTSKSS